MPRRTLLGDFPLQCPKLVRETGVGPVLALRTCSVFACDQADIFHSRSSSSLLVSFPPPSLNLGEAEALGSRREILAKLTVKKSIP